VNPLHCKILGTPMRLYSGTRAVHFGRQNEDVLSGKWHRVVGAPAEPPSESVSAVRPILGYRRITTTKAIETAASTELLYTIWPTQVKRMTLTTGGI